jgi:hypothetical protein
MERRGQYLPWSVGAPKVDAAEVDDLLKMPQRAESRAEWSFHARTLAGRLKALVQELSAMAACCLLTVAAGQLSLLLSSYRSCTRPQGAGGFLALQAG